MTLLDHSDAVHAAAHKKPSRGALIKAARDIYLYHQRTGRMHYTQSPLRMSIVRHKWRPPYHEVIFEDCSSFVTACYWTAGYPDPNHLGYNGQGYTGTLAAHGRVVTGQPRPGDLCFYGNGSPWHHVTMVSSNVKLVYSHGFEGGPRLVALRYRSDLGEIRRYV